MVTQTKRDDGVWFQCEKCGLLLDDQIDAKRHEEACDAKDPTYFQ
ncbi:DUF7128 family protein [Natronocalculus amylovorans]|nr:hypothetical protein [Natronocalculus amylovorans]